MRKNIIYLCLLVVLSGLFFWNWRNRVYQESFNRGNATVYVYPCSYEEVVAVVLSLDHASVFKNLPQNETQVRSFNLLTERERSKLLNENDMLIGSKNVRMKSHLYKDWLGRACDSNPVFRVHCEAMNQDSTVVSVDVVDGSVYYGTKICFFPTGKIFGGGIGMCPRTLSFSSTSIEESEILHAIGKALQVKNLPPIYYPE